MSQNTARAAQARLEQLVAARGWTLEDLAARCGVEHERLLDFAKRTDAEQLGRIASSLAPADGTACILFLLGVDDDVPSVAEEVEEVDDEREEPRPEDRGQRPDREYEGALCYLVPEHAWERVMDGLEENRCERCLASEAEGVARDAWASVVAELSGKGLAALRRYTQSREAIVRRAAYEDGARHFANALWTYARGDVPGARIVYTEERGAQDGAA